jgi:hypothetical protein
MRTDVKIGIAIGLLVMIVAAIYFIVFSPGGQDPADPNDRQVSKDQKEQDPARDPLASRREPWEDTIDRKIRREKPDKKDPAPTEKKKDNGVIKINLEPDKKDEPEKPEKEDPLDRFSLDNMVKGVTGDKDDTSREDTTKTEVARSDDDDEIRRRETGRLLTDPRGATRTETRTTTTTDEDEKPDAGWTKPRKYIVKETDDDGFSGIAMREYGSAKHWTLIRDANPSVSSVSMRAGQELILPPPPKPTTAARSGSGTSRLDKLAEGGKVVSDFNGKKYYVIKKGDNGFSTAAKEAYGDAKWKYVLAIQKANPELESTSLKEGDRVLIPDISGIKTSTSGTSDTSRASEGNHGKIITGADGNKYYVVQKGDNGFSTVAKVAYGEGKWSYVRAIAAANPELDSRSLMPGMKVKIPTKPAEGADLPRLVTTSSGSGSTDSSSGGSDSDQPDRPDFSDRLDDY